jgi:hypothetical protein
MAKNDGAEELANLKHSVAVSEIKLKTQKSIYGTELKISGNLKQQVKEKEKLNELDRENEKIRLDVLNLEKKIGDKAKEQEKGLINHLKKSATILSITKTMQSAIEKISATQRDTANHMGVTLNKAAKINKNIAKELALSGQVDTTRHEILETMHEMDDVMRSSNLYNEKMAMNLSVTANKLNISRTEAAKLSADMQMIDGASAEAAESTLVLVKNFADAKGVKMGAVMKDVAAQGKAFTNWSGMSLKNMMRTAVETRKMGFELSDAMNVANKLLDVEGSIESQMKFNVLTGKDANFDKARALMLEGKHAEALAEVRDQVGDISKLNILELQSLEQATGMTRDKLMTSTAIKENAATNVELEQQAAEALERGDTALANQLLSQLDGTTAAEANANAQTNIQESLATQFADQKKMKNIMLGIQIIQGTIAAISAAKAVAELTAASALTMGLGIVGILAGLSLGVAAMTGAFSSTKPAAKKPGDLGIDPNGGPVVMSPKEGGLFQGTKNDGISMSPSHGVNGGGEGSSGVAQKLDTLIEVLSRSGTNGSSAVAQKLDIVIQLLSQQRILNVSGTQLAEVMDLERVPVGIG